MAETPLTELWLHEPDDLADSVRLEYSTGGEDITATGQVRSYAGGVRRAVSRAGVYSPLRYSGVHKNRAALTALRARAGRVQLLRDSDGRKVYGIFWASSVEETRTAGDKVSWSLTFEPVTFSEEV